MRIIVSGSLAYDVIMDFPDSFKNHILPEKIHILNVSFLVSKIKKNFGGTAGNIAYTLSLLGMNPNIYSCAGKDFSDYKKWLASKKVEISHVKIIKNENTAIAHIITDQKNNQITAFCPGAMLHSCPDIHEVEIKKSLYGIIAPGNISDMILHAEAFRRFHLPYIFDPGQQITAMNKSQINVCITGAYAFISNDYELGLVLNKTGLAENELLKKVKILVTTLGERGSIITIESGKKIKIPSAKPKKILDPTGAGDAYRAGFLAGLIQHKGVEVSARMGSLAAAYAIENFGTQNHNFTLAQFLERYRLQFGERL